MRAGALDVPRVIWATTVGLAAAHWLAFSLAAQLIAPSQDDRAIARQMLAQVGAAGLIASLVTVPILVLADDAERDVAFYATAALSGLTILGRERESSRARTPDSLIRL
jgi:hypothetical protein